MEQATGDAETIFWGVNSWGNESAPPSAPLMLRIPGGADAMMTQQATALTEGGNATMAETTSKNLHRVLIGGTPTLHNTVVGGNGMGGTTGIMAGTPVAPATWKKHCTGRRSTGWSVLTEAVKIFEPEETMQEFLKNY